MGVYYVYYKLSYLGWKIVPVEQELHQIQKATKKFLIKIHSLTKIVPVPFSQGLTVLDTIDFLVICNNLQGQPNLIVMEPETVKKVIHIDTKKKGKYWLQDRVYQKYDLKFDQVFG